jgi:hypothetical protein
MVRSAAVIRVQIRSRRNYVSSTILESLPRYLSVVFPFYLAIAVTTARSEGLYILSVAASTGLMAVCLVLYVCGYFMT